VPKRFDGRASSIEDSAFLSTMWRSLRGGERHHGTCDVDTKRSEVRKKEGDVISNEVKSTEKKAISLEKK
jgi:hypothetical protein